MSGGDRILEEAAPEQPRHGPTRLNRITPPSAGDVEARAVSAHVTARDALTETFDDRRHAAEGADGALTLRRKIPVARRFRQIGILGPVPGRSSTLLRESTGGTRHASIDGFVCMPDGSRPLS